MNSSGFNDACLYDAAYSGGQRGVQAKRNLDRPCSVQPREIDMYPLRSMEALCVALL
jgi:hypothetical protein